MYMGYLKNNNGGGITPISVLIIIVVFVVCVFIIVTGFMPHKPSCNPEDQKKLRGILRGFYENSSYYSVVVGNQSYVFCYVLSESYLNQFIGEKVEITYCRNVNSLRDVKVCFDMVGCVIVE